MNKAIGQREFESRFAVTVKKVNRRLAELLPPENEYPISLHRAMRYSTLHGGKRLRAVLCMWSHYLSGDAFPDDALDAACAIECLHAYTLIHDDLPSMDDDDVRRGNPACHIKFGESIAVLAGDALQALSFEIISRGGEAPAGNCVLALRILSEAAGSLNLVGGQVADIEGEGREPNSEMVRFIHTRKTAKLISASMAVGTALSSGHSSKLDQICEIGEKAGLAFQIIDDLLDIEGREASVGKALRKDTGKGKITWPACFGRTQSHETARLLIDESIDRIRDLGDEGYIGLLFKYILERVF